MHIIEFDNFDIAVHCFHNIRPQLGIYIFLHYLESAPIRPSLCRKPIIVFVALTFKNLLRLSVGIRQISLMLMSKLSNTNK